MCIPCPSQAPDQSQLICFVKAPFLLTLIPLIEHGQIVLQIGQMLYAVTKKVGSDGNLACGQTSDFGHL